MRAGGVEGPQSRHRLGRRDRVDAEIGGSFLGLRNAQPLTPTSPQFRVEWGGHKGRHRLGRRDRWGR